MCACTSLGWAPASCITCCLSGRPRPGIEAAEIGTAAMPIGRDALFNLLREARLPVVPRRAYHKTTHSHHHLRRHPNLLKGDDRINPTGSEQLWVADITYLPTQAQCVYLKFGAWRLCN